ncbi:MAG: exodeoxyribonuclease VII small subunit [Candidatus Aminicenantes bacterium]|jgi:exodeoxyribonuclease VII small subunit
MTTPSFEKALEDLEKIVEKLEKGGLSLSDSLAQFEKGVKLARFLRDELEKAEKKVSVLLKDEKGKLKEEPFDLAEQDASAREEEAAPGKGKDASSEEESPEDEKDDELPF